MTFGGRQLTAIIACLAVVLSAAGCAGVGPSSAEAGGIDFSRDQAANGAAAELGAKLGADLPRFSSYAGLQIVRYGIEVDNVGTPSAEMRAAVDRDAQRYQGSEIPVRFRSVRYSEKELQAVMDRLTADVRSWAQRGIEFSSWGIDIVSNTVEIKLAHYSDAYRAALTARYGDRVTVYPHDSLVVGD
jgi:hypothetical protein